MTRALPFPAAGREERPARVPVVLPLHPERGWAEASSARRLLALACPALLVVWAVAAPWAGDLVAFSSLLAAPSFCSAARVLRPDPGGSVERRLRHAIAGASTAAGTAVMLLIARDASADSGWYPIAVASLGLVVTLPWGLLALVVRTARTPVGRPAAAR